MRALACMAFSAVLTTITPPARAFQTATELTGKGVQIYECEIQGDRPTWTLRGPDAELFNKDGRLVGHHRIGPVWESEDGSSVSGKVVFASSAPSASDAPWLVLSAKSAPTGGEFAHVQYITRSETHGGAAPSGGCDSNHVGSQKRMSYTATYTFFAG